MSLELSKEMLQVKGYLADAKLLVEQLVTTPGGSLIVEVARMLQQERHHGHKKSPEKGIAVHSKTTDRVMADARNHPQVPLMMSASDDEPVRERKSRPRKSKPTAVKKPAPKRKPDPRKKASKSKSRRR
jgi:hypothetical protein